MENIPQDMRNRDQAVSFIENRTVLGDMIQHDSGQQLWVEIGDDGPKERKKQIWAEATAEMEALAEAIEKYQVKVLKKPDKSDVRMTDWSAMMRQVQAAATLYEKEPMTSGVKGKIKKALHRIRDAGPKMGHWCSLLPTGDYGGTIAGVFSILATAASKSSEVRECIFEAMQDVPEYVRQTGAYLKIYEINKSDQLEIKSAELCRSILVLFRQIMVYFNQGSARRAFQSIAQGDSYEDKLRKSKRDVERLAENIQKEAQLLEHERINEVLGETRELVSRAKAGEEDTVALKQMFSEGIMKLNDMGKGFQALLESSSLFNPRLGKARVQEIESGAASFHTLEGSSGSKEQPTQAGMNRKEVLKILDFDRGIIKDDLESCQELQSTLDLRAQDEASWVIQSDELRLWLTLPESRDLLINGHRSDALEQLSPLSLVCAELVSLFKIAKDAIVASYFCGLHSDCDQDEKASFPGMLTSLIGQIVHQSKRKKFDLDYSCVEINRKRLSRLDLRALSNVFGTIVRQLPKDKIFYCVIDGILLYEAMDDSGDSSDTIYFLRKLYKLLTPAVERNSATMKLLLTCPGESMNIGDPQFGFSIQAEDILDVDCVDGDRQGVLEVEELRRSVRSI